MDVNHNMDNNNNHRDFNPVHHFTNEDLGDNRNSGGDNSQANNNSYINMNITPVPPRTPYPDIVPNTPIAEVPPSMEDLPDAICNDKLDLNYSIVPAIICAVCFIFGVLYCFLGYRFFKATMFLTGFIFGSVITYLICLEEQLLPLEGKIGVTILVGIIVGLITMLVQQVGLFITGFTKGGLLGTIALVILEFFYHPKTVWICIGVIFLSGLLCALLILYFQRGLTILSTAMCGSALIAVAVDYFVEKFYMVNYVYDRMRNMDAVALGHVCWFSWVILGIWPFLFLVGVLTQWKITAKGINHKNVVSSKRKNKRKVNLQKIRERESKHECQRQREALAQSLYPNYYHDKSENDRDPQQSTSKQPTPEAANRYLHLYQVRRVNGDVISQSYIQNIQHKLSTAVRKKVVSAPPTRPPPQPSVECDQMQSSIIETQTQISPTV